MTRSLGLSVVAVALLAGCALPPSNPTTFFVTSAGPGKGADLGGLAGADAHCERLASAAGVGDRGWRAYLSTTGAAGVNARDRIGLRDDELSGSWNASHPSRGCSADALKATGGSGLFYCFATR